MSGVFFDGLSNAKFNALKTDIVNQALQGKYAVSGTYYKVLKLAVGLKQSASTRYNNRYAGLDMVHPSGPGRGDQGGRGRGRVREVRGAHNRPNQQPAGKQSQAEPEGERGTSRRMFPMSGRSLRPQVP